MEWISIDKNVPTNGQRVLVCGRKFYTAEIEDDGFKDGKQGMYLFYKEWRSRH